MSSEEESFTDNEEYWSENGDWDEDVEEINENEEKEVEYILIDEYCKIKNHLCSVDIEYDSSCILEDFQKKYFRDCIININYNKYKKITTIQKNHILSNIIAYKFHNKTFINDEMLIINIIDIINNIIKNINKRCIECDKELPFFSYKPCFCKNNLCKFHEETIGSGSLRIELIRDIKVTDLLISAFYANCFSRHSIDGLNISKIEAAEIIESCPSPEILYDIANSAKNEEDLKSLLTIKLYDLLKYIFDSCSFYIEYIEKIEKFKIITSSEKEAKFNNLKSVYSPKIVYHGSSFENWYNIIRIGLKNYSGTSRQANGAVYGKGIYLAALKTVSIGYSTPVIKLWKNTNIFTSKNYLIAECEVCHDKNVSSKDVKYISNINYFIVPNEDYVNIKYISIGE